MFTRISCSYEYFEVENIVHETIITLQLYLHQVFNVLNIMYR